jgi:inositol 1,4,5-triphosphate receptor type 1
VFGIVHLLACVGITSEYVINNAPRFNRHNKVNFLKELGRAGGNLAYYLMLSVTSVLALGNERLAVFYCIHVLHLVPGTPKLERGVNSVVRPFWELVAVFALVVSVVYIFSVIGFIFFRMDFITEDGQFCDTLGQCFTTMLMFGMTAGAGTREVLAPGNSRGFFADPHYIGRVVFDLMFWVVIPVISMNLILGIIVDTFSELRNEGLQKDEEFQSKCFICSKADHEFDRPGARGFKHHIRNEHYMWNYVYFALHLNEMEANERNYHELYLYEKLIVQKDPSPFPINRALSLGSEETETGLELRMLAMQSQMEEQIRSLTKQVAELTGDDIKKAKTASADARKTLHLSSLNDDEYGEAGFGMADEF